MGANAGTAVPTYASGDVLTAANLNLTNAGVPVFATTVTRDAAFGGAGEKTLAEGQMCYIEAAPKRFQVYNGTAFIDFFVETTTYTPTLTNATLGNGTITGRYQQFGKFVYVYNRFVLGSTSSVSTNPQFSLPVTASTSQSETDFGRGRILDAGVAYFDCTFRFSSSTNALVECYAADQSFNRTSAVGATTPMTWTTNDAITCSYCYEAA